MNADRLLALYEKVAGAPDAVPRLRRFVLDLAVRGKLVPQDGGDEPAEELLKRIAAEKARLVKAGEIRKPKPTEPIEPDDVPYHLPRSWRWVRLSDILTKLTDGTHHSPPNGPEGEFLYITAKNIKDDGVKLDDVSYVSSKVHEEIYARCNPEPGDILYIKDGATTGIVTVNDLEEPFSMLSSVALLKLPPCIFNHLIVVFLRSPFFYEQMRSFMKGAAITRVTLKRMGPALLPLPPLAEQHRIVAKVEELMALLDRLEAARAAREATRDRLTAASLARLTAPAAAPDAPPPSGQPEPGAASDTATSDKPAKDFPAHARFALATLPALTTRPDQIKPLRQAILNLAVRGKLVEQDPADEPASELMGRMVKERAETVARRKIRGATPPKAPSAVKEGFRLPASWGFSALGQIALITDPNPSHRYPDYSGGTVPILSTREFAGDDGWNPETAKLTTQAFWEYQKEICDFAKGDIIFARKGRLGLPRFLPPFEKFTFSHTLFSIKPMAGLDPSYLRWLLRRDEVVAWLTNEMNQNTGVPTLGKAKTERLPIPLPPLAEQHRIVAKVDALMALCDRLEAALTTTDTTRARLLEALLHEALEPASTDAMEAAE